LTNAGHYRQEDAPGTLVAIIEQFVSSKLIFTDPSDAQSSFETTDQDPRSDS
jgi:hypothetical protein